MNKDEIVRTVSSIIENMEHEDAHILFRLLSIKNIIIENESKIRKVLYERSKKSGNM